MRFNKSEKTSSVKASIYASSIWKPSLAQIYRSTVSELPVFAGLPVNTKVVPMVNTSAAYSPSILPIESIAAVAMPGNAEGSTTLNIVRTLLAPKP